MARLLRTIAVALGPLLVGSLACSPDAKDQAVADEDIVKVPHTNVERQSIGNCWIYAHSTWIESMRLAATGEQVIDVRDREGPRIEASTVTNDCLWPPDHRYRCYDVADLPRTNNALEQAFGSHRYHERRASGRKGASPALVLRGGARLLARLANGRRE